MTLALFLGCSLLLCAWCRCRSKNNAKEAKSSSRKSSSLASGRVMPRSSRDSQERPLMETPRASRESVEGDDDADDDERASRFARIWARVLGS